VKSFTWEMAHFLVAKGVKMLVIACNTATAVALEEIANELPIPVLGVIQPGARAALKESRNLNIGIIGTEGTIKSHAYEQAILSIHSNVTLTSLACPKFVPLVESAEYQSQIAKKIVAETLQPLKGKQIDTLILGCTHYPLLGRVISNFMGNDVHVISSGDETASEVSAILDYKHLLRNEKKGPEHEFFTTGSSEIFMKIAMDWLELENILVKNVQIKA
jgi:glutamate racemase